MAALRLDKMRTVILLFVIFSLAYADPSTSTTSTSSGSTETSSKTERKTPNSITAAPASTLGKTHYYLPRTPTFVQLVQKPWLATGQHGGGIPQTTLILAQPALLPHNLVYNQASAQHAQQLLNYFHGNPTAKYQLLYGYQPQSGSVQAQPVHPIAQTPVYYATAPPDYQNYPYLAPQHYSYLEPQTLTLPGFSHNQAYHTPQYQIPVNTYTQPQPTSTHSHPHSHSRGQSQVPQHPTFPSAGSSSGSHTQGHSQAPFVPSQQVSPSLSKALHQVSSQLHSLFQHPTNQNHQYQQYQYQQYQHAQPQTPAQTQPPQNQHPQSQYSSHYYSQGPQTFTTEAPIKTVAPIITGLEHFTPEQQTQIKEQLKSHFGSLTQINGNSLQANHPEYQTKYRIVLQSPESEVYSTHATQPQVQGQGHGQADNITGNGATSHKVEAREESQPSIHQAHQPHHLTQTHGQGQQPVYTYGTPQYTKG